MSEQFIGELRIFGFTFPPRGWAQCDGQLLPIGQYQALFSLLGTSYGGDGRTNFGLPDLRASVPAHAGGQLTLGQKGGEATHVLGIAELPVHQHAVVADDAPAATDGQKPEANRRLAQSAGTSLYAPYAAATPMSGEMIGPSGGNLGHENMQPFLVLNVCIALNGIYPSRN